MKTCIFRLVLPVFFVLASLCVSKIYAQNEPMRLWEKDAPGAVGNEPLDVPMLMPFPAPADKATGAAVIVCPGGGYSKLVDGKEGSEIAKWLNSLGISAFVLKYRIGMRYHQPAPLQDVSRAMRTIRVRAKEWNLDENRIGIIGFSAGGHLASTLGTHFDTGKADSPDPIERASSRPDLMMLIYPVITMGEFTHPGSKKNLLDENPTDELIKLYSNELQIKKDTPPTFMIHTMDDKVVPVENSLMFVTALRKAGIPIEFHLYETGPHGFGLAPNNQVLASWTQRCADWLKLHGFLDAKTTAAK